LSSTHRRLDPSRRQPGRLEVSVDVTPPVRHLQGPVVTTTAPPGTHAAPSTERPRAGRAAIGVPVGLVVVLGSLQGLGPLSLDTYLPALPTIATELGASTSATQLTLTATLAGLGLGQLVFGPLSDALGRRRPLLVGLVLYVVASGLCSVAPSIEVLTGLRFVQGFAGAAGMVTAMAVARDSSSGAAMARLFAALMLVTGVAPVSAATVRAMTGLTSVS